MAIRGYADYLHLGESLTEQINFHHQPNCVFEKNLLTTGAIPIQDLLEDSTEGRNLTLAYLRAYSVYHFLRKTRVLDEDAPFCLDGHFEKQQGASAPNNDENGNPYDRSVSVILYEIEEEEQNAACR